MAHVATDAPRSSFAGFDRLRLAPEVIVPTVVAISFCFLILGFTFKAPCLAADSNQVGREFSQGCYNDVQYLWGQRGLDQHIFPYVHGHLVHTASGDSFTGGTVEYPVLTGVFIWAAALPAHTDRSYFIWTAWFLLPFGLLASYLLAKMVGWRALLFVAAPSIVLYAFHNWDLLVVAATVGAFFAWSRGRPGWAAVWLGVGASLKFYPLFFLVPLVLDRVSAGDRRGTGRVLLGGLGSLALINVPFAVANPSGWWAPYAFQKLRNADFTSNSIWVWGAQSLHRAELNQLTPILIAGSIVIAAAVGYWRARREGAYPFIQVCGAIVMAFVLLNKVFSPQYALWLLPFFALIRVRWGWWVAFVAADLTLYFGLFRWFYDTAYRHVPFTSLALANQAVIVGIWMRALLVALLYVVFLCSRSAVDTAPAVRRRSAAPATQAA